MKEQTKKTIKEYKEDMIALRATGMPYREIAKQFGTSAQYVYNIIAESCNRQDPARQCDVDIEKIVYEGIYDLFAKDYKMTSAKLARIAFGCKISVHKQKEKIRRLIYNNEEVNLSIRNIRNICEYIGEPFERVFKVRQ